MAKPAIVIGASSGIGAALCGRWLARGERVAGTYRTERPEVEALRALGVTFAHCDIGSQHSISRACAQLRSTHAGWERLVVCPGTLEPVGRFDAISFDAFEASVRTNFTGPLRVVRELLDARAPSGAAVLFFAGGGTNGPVPHYSAYTASKIALVKACELLDAELPDVRFSIVGPGWVDTPIHRETLRAGERAGENLARTRRVLAERSFTPMERLLECCDWLLTAPREVVGGRNFSVAHDAWGTSELEARLRGELDLFKLRRAGNADAAKRLEEVA